jgi:hypothetical protein
MTSMATVHKLATSAAISVAMPTPRPSLDQIQCGSPPRPWDMRLEYMVVTLLLRHGRRAWDEGAHPAHERPRLTTRM